MCVKPVQTTIQGMEYWDIPWDILFDKKDSAARVES